MRHYFFLNTHNKNTKDSLFLYLVSICRIQCDQVQYEQITRLCWARFSIFLYYPSWIFWFLFSTYQQHIKKKKKKSRQFSMCFILFQITLFKLSEFSFWSVSSFPFLPFNHHHQIISGNQVQFVTFSRSKMFKTEIDNTIQ